MTRKLLFYSFFVLVLVTVGVFLFVTREAEKKELPLLGKVPSFELTDSRGKTFSDKKLLGKIWVADFIFTTCAGPCPMMTKNMGAIYRSYLLEKNIDFVSFSVNPDYDSPQVLAEYALRQKADTSRWHFLTGPLETIKRLAVEDFKVGAKDNPIFHSTHFALVDPQMHIRGYYEGTTAGGTKQLFGDIARLAKETQP
ncbi:MAG: SCO family protein [Candidatus Omnitrophica bacterium]|nr:SCO family protein [Candidatus Omnitrophota bacterium]